MTMQNPERRRSRGTPVPAVAVLYSAGLTALFSVLGIGMVVAMARIDYYMPHTGAGPDPRPQWDLSPLPWAITPTVALLLSLVALVIGVRAKGRERSGQGEAPHASPAVLTPRRTVLDRAITLCTLAMVINLGTAAVYFLLPG
ncbi:hypothetical protein [Brachybacterium muris]|uniref:Uncharacterized protein n=1 Tax=Brachybacterium muris UCD-AY4 TaxID=1249481 RepID=A0A022KYH9_9MICO|nr:hypothetical protein [Brachybacterium muris]EYT49532.1 hypothetical protein D641_0108220 [Brachybacterium muris UCD-AY4]